MALKYWFARALEAAPPGVLALLEPELLRAVYAIRFSDGQLTVYLRLNDVPVPAIYGPSADDPRFL